MIKPEFTPKFEMTQTYNRLDMMHDVAVYESEFEKSRIVIYRGDELDGVTRDQHTVLDLTTSHDHIVRALRGLGYGFESDVLPVGRRHSNGWWIFDSGYSLQEIATRRMKAKRAKPAGTEETEEAPVSPVSPLPGEALTMTFNPDDDITMTYMFDDAKHRDDYSGLYSVLMDALDQACRGKGKERHANDAPFESQTMQTISDTLGRPDGMAYQVMKKTSEAMHMKEPEQQIRELLGAINYAAGMIIWINRHN